MKKNASSTRVKRKRIVAVSGGFDPIHPGHTRLFQEARKLGDSLVVILNNDHWLRKKKGVVFMRARERKEVLEALKGVDRVVLSSHAKNPSDMSVSQELLSLRPSVFANGGDRTGKNIPELAVCKRINCRAVFSVGKGGKIESSSWLLATYTKRATAPLGRKAKRR